MLDLAQGPRSNRFGIGRVVAAVAALFALVAVVVAVPRKKLVELAAATPFTQGDLVTVVIGTVGRPSLHETVLAVLDQKYEAIEVVVVDNAPGSGRVEAALKGVDDPRCTVVREATRGISAARNCGVRNASGTVVAFTDDDAEPDPGWIQALADVYAADTRGIVTGVTGRVVGVGVDTAEQRWFEDSGMFDKGTERTLWTLVTDRTYEPELGMLGTAPLFPYTAGEMGSGNNISFRRSALEQLEGFDEHLGAGTPTKGGEDLEMFRRVVLQRGAIVYTPDAIVGHHHRSSDTELRQQMFGYGSGMSAVLTKLVFAGGAPALGLFRRLPIGIRILLAPASERFADGAQGMPLDLKMIELLGYAAGPFLYVRALTMGRQRSNS